MSETENLRLHATVEGRVQGVGFRMFVLDNAAMLNLTGWVRNRWDGTVEVCAEGDRESLDQLLGVLRRGPRAGFVTNVKLDWQPATGEFKRFEVHRTA